MLSCDGRNGGMIKHPLLSLDEWAVCLYDDSVLLAIVYYLSLLTERMKLTQARDQ